MRLMRSAKRELGSEWGAHHDDSTFNSYKNAKDICILVEPVYWTINVVLATVHGRGVNKASNRALFLRHMRLASMKARNALA